jgi:hypothetical protein
MLYDEDDNVSTYGRPCKNYADEEEEVMARVMVMRFNIKRIVVVPLKPNPSFENLM